MCGIVGAISSHIDKETFQRSVSCLKHRGPDNIGYWNHENVWLGHTRLAINDLSQNANQPFEDPVSQCVVVFNGEIYNYRELRGSLSGESFQTDSEVEVLARLYRIYGADMLGHLDGMFAFVIYDKKNNLLFGARDRIGKKPFFYHYSTTGFYFSSELKAFKELPVTLTLDTRILDNLLNFTHFHGESIFQNIRGLKPGTSFKLNLQTMDIKFNEYFNLLDLIDENEYMRLSRIGIKDASAELAEKLEQSVKKRLISDVPVGVIASGGLDSSLIATFANRYNQYDLLHIDSVDSSELDDAKLLADHLGVDLAIDKLDYQRFCELIEDTIRHWEYPLVHTNATGILLVARLARKHGYKVLLGGEGADELFGGYPQHRLYRLALKISAIFKILPIKVIQSIIYARSDNKGGGIEPTLQHFHNNSEFSSFYDRYGFIGDEHARKVQAFLASDLREYLVPLLSRADRMTMASGVEMRLPFLDIDIIRMALNMPLNYKMKVKQQKAVLRVIGSSVLPHRTKKKKKVGFTVDYAKQFIQENSINRFPNLDRYMPSEEFITHLMNSGAYHKIIRYYSLDKLCGEFL